MRTSLSALLVLLVFAGSTFTGCGRGSGVVARLTTFTVGGTVTGLNGTVVLELNGSEQLQITSSGAYSFTTTLADEAPYEVTVLDHPTSQTIGLTNESGAISGGDVSNNDVAFADMDWTHPADLSDSISPDGTDAQYAQINLSDHGNATVTWHQFEGSQNAIFKGEYRS